MKQAKIKIDTAKIPNYIRNEIARSALRSFKAYMAEKREKEQANEVKN